MHYQKFAKTFVMISCLFLMSGSYTHAIETTGEFGIEGRLFPKAPSLNSQNDHGFSLYLTPEIYHDFAKGNQRISFDGFVRWDASDKKRTHFDVRELYWRGTFNDFDLYIGARKVFWGVAESIHLVDIINQSDNIENVDNEDKFGQPMLSLTYTTDWGTTDIFYMPYFRARIYPGVKGRIRFALPIADNPIFESDAKEWHSDFAIRWSHILGNFDIAISHFEGTSRAPKFVPKFENNQIKLLTPFYAQLSQTGMELQYISGDWLWKLETVSRERSSIRSTALVGGFEYTFYGTFGTSADLGLVVEYQFDDQPNPIFSNNDMVVGTRYTFNDMQDTDVLAFIVVDTENSTVFGSIEGNRRVGAMWEITIESRMFLNVDETDPLYQIRDDSYLQVEMVRFF